LSRAFRQIRHDNFNPNGGECLFIFLPDTKCLDEKRQNSDKNLQIRSAEISFRQLSESFRQLAKVFRQVEKPLRRSAERFIFIELSSFAQNNAEART